MANKAPRTPVTSGMAPAAIPEASPILLAALAEFQHTEDQILNLTETLKDLKARAKYLGEHVIAECVEVEHLNEGARLPDGSVVTFRQDVKTNIRNEDRPALHQYLKDTDQDELLKHVITISVNKGSARLANALYETLQALAQGREDVTLEANTELPGPTMMAWVRQRLRDGLPIPQAVGLYAPWRAVRS